MIETDYTSPKAKIIADRQINSITCAHAAQAHPFPLQEKDAKVHLGDPWRKKRFAFLPAESNYRQAVSMKRETTSMQKDGRMAQPFFHHESPPKPPSMHAIA